MSIKDLSEVLRNWDQALETFNEVLSFDETPIVRDAAIKRFEYNFELAWKTIKQFAQVEGHDCNSPRSAFKLAFQLGWAEDDDVWLDILDARNQTMHTYQIATAESVYLNLPKYLKAFTGLHAALQKQIA